MAATRTLLAVALVVTGCNPNTTGNTVLRPPPDEKAKAAAILKEHGVAEEIIAMRENGDAWIVTVDNTQAQTAPGGMSTLSTPASYKVAKSGGVVGPNGKELPRR